MVNHDVTGGLVVRRRLMAGLGLLFVLALVPLSLSHGWEGPRRAVYTLARAVEKQRASWTLPALTIAGETVTLHYDQDDEAVAPLVLSELERLREPVADILGLPAPKAVTAVLHPTRSDLAAVFGWQDGERAHGVYAAGIVRLLSPRVWLGPVPDSPDGGVSGTGPIGGDYAQLYHQYGPTAHELAHYILDMHTAGNYPAWLSEGIAQWVEFQLGSGQPPGPDKAWHVLAEPYTFAQLTREFDELPDQLQAYAQSYLAVAYLEQAGGREAVQGLIGDLARGQTLDAALQSRFGLTVLDLQERLLRGENSSAGGAGSEFS